MPSDTLTWRQYLYQVFEQDTKLPRNVAREMGVKPITLLRWARGEATPHHPIQALRQVAQAENFAAYAEEFLSLVAHEYPGITTFIEEGVREVPSTFYRELFITLTAINDDLMFWTLAHQMSQFAPLLMGAKQELTLTIFLLTPPIQNEMPVRSLYTPSNQGKNIIYPMLHYYPTLLGAESSLMQALLMREPLLLTEEELEIAAISLQMRGRIAGLLVLHSLTTDFFTPRRLSLVADIARPLTLGFPDEQFYPPTHISLALLPSRQEQEQCQRETPFVHRVRNARMCQEGSQSMLERQALQELEADLIFLSKTQGAITT